MSLQTTHRIIEVGAQASLTRIFLAENVRHFADISGDHNPVHLDAAYAAQTRFGRPIAHGMLVAGLISAVLGTELPGSDLARIVKDSRCGWVVEPGSPEVLAVLVREVMALPEIERVQRGRAGREYARHYLTRAARLPQVVRVLEQAASKGVQQDARV